MRDSNISIPTQNFHGLVLEMVCLAEYSVYLHFSNKNGMISTTLDCIFDNKTAVRGADPLPILQRVIGSKVEDARIVNGSDILVAFSNSDELLIRNSNLNTESYTVEINGRVYVV